MPLTGGCQCGAVRYAVSAGPLAVYVCHCLECRRQSASAFGVSVLVPADALRRERGEVRTWTRPTDGGRTLDCTFCPACGSRLWHATPGGATVTVKGGSLDGGVDLTAAVHLWTKRKLPGVVIPAGATCFDGEPP